MLARNHFVVSLLRGLKSALQYEAVSQGRRDIGLSEDQALAVLSKEAKKRQETADLYQQAGEQERANQELSEKKLIESFLPEQLSEAELKSMVERHIAVLEASGMGDMGKVISAVKNEAGASADGSTISKLVKVALGQQG